MNPLTRIAITAAGLSGFALITPLAATASAHAIIRLEGVSAVAGATSAMTLLIQHGCLPSEPTVQVQAFVGKPWRSVKPQKVDGWTSSVKKQAKGGWQITWINQGEPIPFGKETLFPITVSWPKTPGTYGMSVWQLCANGSTYYWNEKYSPASATNNSPGLTPKPEVLVVAKPTSSAPSTSKPSSTPTTQKHMH
jgi:uncharacterized protein YcnI